MPDFAVQLQFLRSRWNKQSMESAIAAADILPPGDVESSPLGSHYAVRGLYPHDYFHGKVRLSRFSTTDLECLMLLMKERGTIPSRDRIVFLDTETTGIQGGAGMCPFLVGIGDPSRVLRLPSTPAQFHAERSLHAQRSRCCLSRCADTARLRPRHARAGPAG